MNLLFVWSNFDSCFFYVKTPLTVSNREALWRRVCNGVVAAILDASFAAASSNVCDLNSIWFDFNYLSTYPI